MARENKIKLELYKALRTDRTGEFTEGDLTEMVCGFFPQITESEVSEGLSDLRSKRKINSRLVGDPRGDYVFLKYSLTKKGNGLRVSIAIPQLPAY